MYHKYYIPVLLDCTVLGELQYLLWSAASQPFSQVQHCGRHVAISEDVLRHRCQSQAECLDVGFHQ